MRLATLIISGVLSFGLFIQSCAVSVGGSISEDLSEAAADKKAAEDLSGGGAIGVFAALLWLVAAGLVISKPKASMWLFSVGAVFCLVGGSSGFSDLYIWAVASVIFALMSWRGIGERERQESEERERYQADVQSAVEAAQQSSPPPPQA